MWGSARRAVLQAAWGAAIQGILGSRGQVGSPKHFEHKERVRGSMFQEFSAILSVKLRYHVAPS